MNSQKTPDSSPLRASYGASFRVILSEDTAMYREYIVLYAPM